jgi:hypothetical protein
MSRAQVPLEAGRGIEPLYEDSILGSAVPHKISESRSTKSFEPVGDTS